MPPTTASMDDKSGGGGGGVARMSGGGGGGAAAAARVSASTPVATAHTKAGGMTLTLPHAVGRCRLNQVDP